MRSLAVLLTVLAVARPSEGKGTEDLCGNVFGNILGYRPSPMVRHIQRTIPWREGRRDVLDWGCGGGRLSQALAAKGASVIAVDMNAVAINSTMQLLENYSQAKVRGPRVFGVPGQLGYKSNFDIVVSMSGALSDGTAMADRIAPTEAMKQAVAACREGGLVMIGEVVKLSHHSHILCVALACLVGRFLPPWLWNRADYLKVIFWYLTAMPFVDPKFGYQVLAIGIGSSIAKSFYDQHINRTAIVTLLVLLLGPWHGLLARRRAWHRYDTAKKSALKAAGLVNVKCHSFPMLRPCQALKGKAASPEEKLAAFLCNRQMFPNARMLIFEGQKPVKASK